MLGFNPAEFSGQLSGLSNAQLKQVAQQYQQDPLRFPLISNEITTRTKMQQAAQMQQAQQQQPPVNQQVAMAAQQLAENQGIAVLPTGEMNFAGGGIVAFADEGLVEYDPGFEDDTYDTGAEGGSRSFRNNNPGNLKYSKFTAAAGATGADADGFAIFPDPTTGANAQRSLLFTTPEYKNLTLQSAISRYAPAGDNNDPDKYFRDVMGWTSGKLDPNAPLSSYTPEQQTVLTDAMRRKEGWISGATPPPTDKQDDSYPETAGTRGIAALPGASKSRSTVSRTPKLGIRDEFDALAKQYGEEAATRATKMKDIFDERKKAAQSALDDYDRGLESLGVFGRERRKRLDEYEKRLNADTEKAQGMALMQAGLAIMSADPRRGVWAAIGAGAGEGLKGYKTDLERIGKRRDSLLDRKDHLEELEFKIKTAQGAERRKLLAARDSLAYDYAEAQLKQEQDIAKVTYGFKGKGLEALAKEQQYQIAYANRANTLANNPEYQQLKTQADSLEQQLKDAIGKRAKAEIKADLERVYASMRAIQVGASPSSGFGSAIPRMP